MSASVIAMRPRMPGDAERLWRQYGAERDRLLQEALAGTLHVDRILAVADLWRAYLAAMEASDGR